MIHQPIPSLSHRREGGAPISRILIVAGSDSGGGAGIQADIKTATMLGAHPMTAITAVTAQNTLTVAAVHALPAEAVIAQIDAVADDIGVDAVKIGMIGDAGIADALGRRLAGLGKTPVVLDPVMVASSGALLADAPTIAALGRLMARATLVTPNAPELAALTGDEISSAYELERAARKLARRHGCSVLAKGAHIAGPVITDILVEHGGLTTRFAGARIESRSTHGTGCTLATAIACGLADGRTLVEAVERGRRYVRAAITAAPGLGEGHGPLGHALGVAPWDLVGG